MNTTRIEFFGGLGVIGSSKILISHGQARVLLDIGLDIPKDQDLFRAPVKLNSASGAERTELALVDMLRRDAAPRIPGLYDERWLRADVQGTDLQNPGGEFAVFISHAHIDHMGLVGFVRSGVDVYAAEPTVAMLQALEVSGFPVAGELPHITVMDHPVQVGEITVTRIDVDHDIDGASGFLVETPEGRIAYTGDIRFHGEHPERSWSFAERVAGVDVLITEGTSLSWDVHSDTPRTESDVMADIEALLQGSSDLQLIAPYERDTEKLQSILDTVRQAGRTVILPGKFAALAARLGLTGVHTWAADRPQQSAAIEAVARAESALGADQLSRVSLAEVTAAPSAYVVVPDPLDFPSLADLPIGPSTALFHTNGTPLGAFDAPWWGPFQDWLAELGIRYVPGGCSGHATADDLATMVNRIHPPVVFPIHSFSPRRLIVPEGTRRVIGEYGAVYGIDGAKLG